ncbi:MAG: YkgJ family cysteine cluster protein [Gemmatimonadaceae bacterium]
MQPPSLPCYPCPHSASCCAYGTTVSEEEAAAIEKGFGPGLVYETQWGEWRTRVRNRRCVMFRDGGCSIHGRPYYPAQCRGFPWVDAVGDRYEHDVTICGEFEMNPELVELQRRLPSGADRSAV